MSSASIRVVLPLKSPPVNGKGADPQPNNVLQQTPLVFARWAILPRMKRSPSSAQCRPAAQLS